MSDPICFTWKVRSSLTNASASLGSNLSLAAAELGGERSWGRRCKWRVAFPLNASLIRFTCSPSAPHRDYFSLTTLPSQPAAANCTAVCRLAPFSRNTRGGSNFPTPFLVPACSGGHVPILSPLLAHSREVTCEVRIGSAKKVSTQRNRPWRQVQHSDEAGRGFSADSSPAVRRAASGGGPDLTRW